MPEDVSRLEVLYNQKYELSKAKDAIEKKLSEIDKEILKIKSISIAHEYGEKISRKTINKAEFRGFTVEILSTSGPKRTKDLYHLYEFNFGLSKYATVRSYLHRMKMDGLITKDAAGFWHMSETKSP